MNSFFLSGSLPPNAEGSAEPCEAIGACLRTQVRICNTYNLCLDSSLYLVLFYSSIPDRLLRPFKNDRQVFNTVPYEFFRAYSLFPLSFTSPELGGKCRALRGDRGKGAYTSQNINTCILCQILTAPVGRVWRLTHFYSVALLLEKRFACHHSAPYFFISLFPTAFYDRSRMTGRYLIPFRKKRFFCFCSHLPLPST